MQVLGEKRIVSASDLNDRLACRHLLHLNLEKALGRLDEMPRPSATGELLSAKGDAHEEAYLEKLKAKGLTVVELAGPSESTIAGLEEAAKATVEAMRAGPEVIFQATFFDGSSRGHTDFLFRVDRPSKLGDFSYEVADTKLARNTKAKFIIQLCFYSELLEKVQGGGPPEQIHVIPGDGVKQSFRLADFAAYYRQLRRSFQADMEAGVPDSRPYPVQHCGICGWKDRCSRQWEETDHLSRVAGIRREHVDALEKAGITTLTGLGQLGAQQEIEGLRPPMLEKLRSQAELQLASTLEEPVFKLLPPQDGRGFARLPEPSAGDIFFDFEGDPLYGAEGLEYLWGYVQVDTGEPAFEHIWAEDPAAERVAFERFIDHVTTRRGEHLGLHVYHYAAYEVTALKRLAGRYASREFELDELLRGGVFVDLYKVVRESLRLGQPSYSIKKVEAYYRQGQDGRETAVMDGGDSIVEFEKWLEAPDGEEKDRIRQAIIEYNTDDCVSTLECRDWLLERRAEAADEFGHQFPWFTKVHEPNEKTIEQYEENAGLRAALRDGVPEDAGKRDPDQQARWLMAQLLDYHQRDARPGWWAHYERLGYAETIQFIEDQEAIGGLTEDETVEPWPEKKSLVHRLRFTPQETKLKAGSSVTDPWTQSGAGTIAGISPTDGWLDLKRGPSFAGKVLPEDVVGGKPFPTPEQRSALRRLAPDVVAGNPPGEGRYPAARDILLAAPPRIAERESGEPIVADPSDLVDLTYAALRMKDSYLFIQGPPGAGKTFSGSHMIAALLAAGHRVGVTANSHKAIHNLLHEVEEVASGQGHTFRGLKRSSDGKQFESRLTRPLIENSDKNDPLNDPGIHLTAGTSFYFCREDTLPVDYLFVDEAGQISLADALALATAARNVVLLGDPQQLPQVSQGRHPENSGVSVLEHLLGEHQTVPPDRGIFLDRTWRMHPDVTAFISELAYESRLASAPGRELQRVNADGDLGGTGLRFVPVEHQGRSARSPEEATRIREIFDGLLTGAPTYTDFKGATHPLTVEDILVVAPYNAQVGCLTETLPDGARVGTVDKFQGQEAQIVIFSMATSSGADIPRNVDFLFSRNRLNVAISRARSLAILVASPDLLNIEANTVDQMHLINGICRFVEMAT